jgi:hypothetical protein
MVAPRTSPVLSDEYLSCLLWLLDDPISAGPLSDSRLQEAANTETAVITGRNEPFVGYVTCTTQSSASGLAVCLRTGVRCHSDDVTLQTLTTLQVGLVQRERLLATEQLTQIPQSFAAIASVEVLVKDFSELDGARMFVADEGRYCWDHIHCADCGRVQTAKDAYAWCENDDSGPVGQKIAFCPDCTNEGYYDRLSLPHVPVHQP